jgi:hypothetical protein
MKHSSPALAFCFSLALGICGCTLDNDGSHCPGPPAEGFLPRTSPENLLENLKRAFNEREYAEYESLLAGDFTYYFSEEDQLLPEIPESWEREQELEASRDLFNPACVPTLFLGFVYGDPCFDAEHFDGADSLWVVEVTDIDLEFSVIPGCPPAIPPYWCRREDGKATFRFRRTKWFHENGQSIWTIQEIDGMHAMQANRNRLQ